MEEVTNKYIAIKAQVDGAPKESDFEVKTERLSLSVKPGTNDIIIKNLYVSIDPYQINRMKTASASQKTTNYAIALAPGEVIDAYGVGKVVASGNPLFQKGDYVVGMISWGEYSKGEYSISQGLILNKLDPMGLPLSYHVGVLGFSGLTAYAGFFQVCKPKKGEKVFISGASGSVGNLVGQYAKILGCYVVGCAGSTKKVKLLKETLGFDEAFNYEEETDLHSTLERYFPDGIDIYFDNVGGEMLDAVISNMSLYGRIAVCGVISEYLDAGKRIAPDMLSVIYKRINIRGFLSVDYMNLLPEFVSTTVDHIQTGKIHVLEDVSSGVESIPSAFLGLFSGNNVGKRIVKVSDE
uniref:2-alkenal reductase (NADP(+)-dependent)-like n=1 Tax=Erigeron canadensis TaxID=72917 RepID=UPI001CB97CE8|nr:2-alkenal reductase (NADP(+)-dependent)-like [Erigeron canadensis]